MSATVTFPNFSVTKILEYIYISGYHKEASVFSICLDAESEYKSIVDRFEYRYSVNSYTNEMNDELLGSTDTALCSETDLFFLRDVANNLGSDSKVLEIGTYLGSSSLAILQGLSLHSNTSYTSIDLYTGFPDDYSMKSITEPFHWDFLRWQKNVSPYSSRIRPYHGASLPLLASLIDSHEKFDLIFLDSAHDIDIYAELALIYCLLKPGSILIVDDIINYEPHMNQAWVNALKYYFAFPSFFNSRYSIARPKYACLPMNYKHNPFSIDNLVSMIYNIDDNRRSGKHISVRNNPDISGFELIISD